ncbi:MAG: thioesterase family protein [Pseudomonadota bacterium]
MADAVFSFESTVRPDWIDHNGHMNVAYFVLAFDEATDAVYETWGIGELYPDSSGCSVFTLGMNVDYHRELFEGDGLRIETTLIDCDTKRIHYVHRMFNAASDALCATNECLGMNVELQTRRSQAFPADVLRALEKAVNRNAGHAFVGRTLGIRRSED